MNQPLSRLVIHLCEGTDQATLALFANLIDPNGTSLISRNLITIHGTALGPAQFASLRPADGLIWSPTSNFLLYGDTTKENAAISVGVDVAIGSDWAGSGTKNVLGELKIAKLTSNRLSGRFSDVQLVRMVTMIPAMMMGWDAFLGSVESGKQADLLTIGKADGDPYATLLASTEPMWLLFSLAGNYVLDVPHWSIRRHAMWNSFRLQISPLYWIQHKRG